MHAKCKLKQAEKRDLEQTVDSCCGAQLQDTEIPPSLNEIVFMRQIQRESPKGSGLGEKGQL